MCDESCQGWSTSERILQQSALIGGRDLRAHHWRTWTGVGGGIVVCARHQFWYVREGHRRTAIVRALRDVESIHDREEG